MQITSEVQCVFRTALPDHFKVDKALEIQLGSNSTNKDLNEVVKQMMEDDGTMDEHHLKEVRQRKLQFMLNDTFLTTTLQDLMEKVKLTSEHVLELWYSFALEKPKPKISIPQDEWVSVLASLRHLKNLKAKTYVAAFYNGDVKIYDGKEKDHTELISVSNLHEDHISDAIYLKSDNLGGNKYLITCSQ